MSARIIARLDIKGPNLVKGIHLEGLRVLGRPERFALDYCAAGADELLYSDAVASLYGRNSLLPIVERTARDVRIPLTVAGGLRSLDDIRAVLAAGADKVALNTAALADPALVARASERFGSSAVIVSIEVKRRGDRFEAFTAGGREPSGVDACVWAERAEKLGAGEILLTSIDREGTGQGFDLELISAVAARVRIPVIACGGAGRASHVAAALAPGRADAVACASLFHYERLERVRDPGEVWDEGNLAFLARARIGQGGFARIEPVSVPALKRALESSGVRVRPGADEVAPCERDAASTARSSAPSRGPEVAIVDLGMGNLGSVAQAFECAGLAPQRVSEPDELLRARAVILPGVGAFGAAMRELETRGLGAALRALVARGTPLVGICLGLQLLASESQEFGRHRGLDLVPGHVAPLGGPRPAEKVPLVGWRPLEPTAAWQETPLRYLRPGVHMYFVHSFALEPRDPEVALTATRFAGARFCSTLLHRNVFACQYHPERSGAAGQAFYAGLRDWLAERAAEAAT